MLKTGIPVWKKHKLMMLSKNVFRQSVSWLKSSIQISCEIDFFTFVAEKRRINQPRNDFFFFRG